MSTPRSPEIERLFSIGIEHFRAARWEEAAAAFRQIRSAGDTSPELEKLLAHAELKAEIARAAVPGGAMPPQPRQTPRPTLIAVGAGVGLLLVIALAIVFWPRPAPTVAVAPAAAPTEVPTRAPRPTAVPAKAPTASTLLVRLADGQELSQTTKNIEIILDASGSMQGKIGDVQKIDIAHEALTRLVENLPDQTNVALRTYGHRRTADCTDIELVAPLAPLDRAAMTAKIAGIRPVNLSRTPMEATIRAVGEDLKGATEDVLVILVSDGDETCDGDPARAAADVHAANPNIRISVIGFDIGPADWRERLQSIAAQGGGSYFDAASSVQLVSALQEAVQLKYRVLDQRGKEVYSGPVGSAVEQLRPGDYTVEVGGPMALTKLVRVSGAQTTVELSAKEGKLTASVQR